MKKKIPKIDIETKEDKHGIVVDSKLNDIFNKGLNRLFSAKKNTSKLKHDFQVEQITPLVVGLIMVGIVVVVGFMIASEVMEISDSAINETVNVTDINNRITTIVVPTWLPILGVTLLGCFIIGLVTGYFRRF